MFDVIIIGSGPSGAHCAKHLGQQKQLEVAVIDARDFNVQDRSHKACGGLLSSHAQKALRQEGIIIPDDIKVEPQLNKVNTSDFSNHLHRFYPRSYINMDRRKFENWLISLIPKNVTLLYSTQVLTIKKTQQGFRLEMIHNKQKSMLECKILIGADGADSIVSRTLFTQRQHAQRYVCMQEHYLTSEVQTSYYGIFDESITDYYSWALQKDKTIIIGSALCIDKQVHQNFDTFKTKLKQNTNLQLHELKSTEGAIVLRPRSIKELNYHCGQAALIGEASGTISPTSAEGFSYAFRSARYLSESLLRYGATEKALKVYDLKCMKLRFSIALKLMKLPFMYQPWLRKWVMLSKITSVK
ncbi:MAG: putative oxidoreductase [Erysipelotrichaceae bacterium]|nr:MAG: hypothetical protein FD179_192 [Erysipelotrichaceae bacterium]TXT17657.1 MAG: putative oxidoreductase [Erysipelotrichaceae bacterium]